MFDDDHTVNVEGHPLRNPFWRELDEGLITFRDRQQFELKSDFFINPKEKTNTFTQEVYIFIPETLQINSQTYTSKYFYLDQTNLIRYKTPFMTFEELLNPKNKNSPFVRIQVYTDKDRILREMMLLGNIFRSTLRVRVRRLIKELTLEESEPRVPPLSDQIIALCSEISTVREEFKKVCRFLHDRFEPNHFDKQIDYVDEFMSDVIEEYLTLLLDLLRSEHPKLTSLEDQAICSILEQEERYRESRNYGPKKNSSEESILYRQGMLEKFMISVLKLRNTRVLMREKHAQFIGPIAAGIAMLVYMMLFVWKASDVVINSAPFVFFAVFFYIIKDRLKESMRSYFQKMAATWFPDFKTEIRSPSGGEKIGTLSERFCFIPVSLLPKGFLEMRYKDDKDELDAYQPIETVIQYKKKMVLYQHKGRLHELNTIFRFNIHRFLEKANDAVQPTLSLDNTTHKLKQQLLPKVYHINIILRNCYRDRKLKDCVEIKKFSVVIDKEGIRRVEHLNSYFHRESSN